MEKGITNRQMFFVLVLVIAAFRTTDIPQLAAKLVGRSGWIVILLFAIPYGLTALIQAKLHNRFTGLTLYEYGQILLGKVLGRILCAAFFLYLFSVLVFLIHNLSSLISMNFLPKTKPMFTLAAAMALLGYVVYKGTDTIARLFELLGVLYIIATVTLCVLMLTQSEITNILPLYNPNEGKEIVKNLIKFGSIYGGMENLLMVPFTKRNQGAPKVALICIFCIGFLFVLIIEGTYGLIGVNNAMAFNDAFVEAIKLAEAPVIERMDIFYFTFGLTSLFAGLIILIHSLVQILTKFIPRAKRWMVVVSVCFASYIAVLLVMGIPAYDVFYQTMLPFLVLPFAVLLPVLLFIIAKIRKKPS